MRSRVLWGLCSSCDVERSQGTQTSSAESLHRPADFFPPKVYILQYLSEVTHLLQILSHLPEFERRSQGSIRGDAKKFALERAQDFIVRFGLPDEFVGVEEPDSRFKEVRQLGPIHRLMTLIMPFYISKFTIGSRTPLVVLEGSWKADPGLLRRLRRKVTSSTDFY